jgi:two-component system alkaline phosphatase synthesis response regulator PhoP
MEVRSLVPNRILMVGDRAETGPNLGDRLEDEGFDVVEARDDAEALAAASGTPPDLILLDLERPVLDGLEVARQIRQRLHAPEIPVLVVSATAEDADKVAALEHGADDFVARPFNPRELVARMRAVLRRTVRPAQNVTLRAGAVEMDLDRYRVTSNGRRLRLTSKEFELLRVLLEARGRIVRRETLFAKVWGHAAGAGITSRTLDVHIRRLRRILEDEGPRILTVRGVGYRLDLSEDRLEFEGEAP